MPKRRRNARLSVCPPCVGDFREAMGHQDSASVDGDRHPTPHGLSVNALTRQSFLPIGSFESQAMMESLGETPGTLEGCISCRSSHLAAGIFRSGGLSCTSLTPGLPRTEYRRSTGFTRTCRVRAPTAVSSTTFLLSLFSPWVPRRRSVEPLISPRELEQSPTLVRRSIAIS